MGSEGFGDRLKRARKGRAVSQRRLARARDGKQWAGHIARLERGDSVPTIETVERIANILECDVCWLAFGRPERRG